MNDTNSGPPSKTCPTCGKRAVPDARAEAMATNFPAPIECTCAKPFDAQMSLRFNQLKESGKGTIFITRDSSPGSAAAPAPAVGLLAGATIGGVYQIEKLIGRGGMGEVYLAEHATLGKKCALKVIPPDQVTDVSWKRFQLEAKTVARLEHVNLVRVTDLGIHEGCLPFYAMEYLKGKNLAEMLHEFGPMPLNEALEVFLQVCDGVECAHQHGVLHRDLKPANIMLTRSGSGQLVVKVLDFGLAKLTKHDRFRQSLTTVGDVFGSPSYMSPEHCGGEELDIRSDIYSIGCTLFEALAGRPPFHSNVPGAVFFGHLESKAPTLNSVANEEKFSPAMEAIVARLLLKDPGQRYQSMAALKADLEPLFLADGQGPGAATSEGRGGKKVKTKPAAAAQAGSTIPTRATTPYSAPSRPKKGPGFALSGLGFVLLVCGLLYVTAVSRLKHADPDAPPQQPPKQSPQQTASGSVPGSVPDLVPGSLPVPAPAAATGAAAVSAPGSAAVSTPGSAQTPAVESAQPTPPGNSKAALAAAGAKVDWDGKPFFKEDLLRGGQPFRHFIFPAVKANPSYFQYGRWPRVQQAPLSQDVFMPASQPVCFVPVSYIASQQFMLNGLGDRDFDEIDLLRRSPEISLSGLSALSKFKAVRSIRFGDSAQWQDQIPAAMEKLINLLNQFPQLDRLIVFAPISGNDLSRIARLGALRELRLQGNQPDLRGCLNKLLGDDNIESFAASGWNLTDDSLSVLATWPHLRRVLLGRITGSHEQIAALGRCPQLNILEMPALKYRDDLASDLMQLHYLKELRFARATWTREQLGQLTRRLPQLQLTVYRNFMDEMNALRQP